jgi:hypothetical protein
VLNDVPVFEDGDYGTDKDGVDFIYDDTATN